MFVKYLCLIALFAVVVQCQVQYVPAQVYIPVNAHIPWNNTYISWNRTNSQYNNNYFGTSNRSRSEPGHIFWGRIGPLDKLLFNEVYFKDSRWWSSREKIIEYPKDVNSGYVRHETISAIHITNKFYQGHHSNASVLSGGVGKQFVEIRLSSTWGYGFKFLVQIFGH